LTQRGRKSAASLAIVDQFRPEPADANPEPAPAHLSPEGRGWWDEVTSNFRLNPHRLMLLQLACEAWDTKTRAAEELRKEGVTYTDDRGNPKA
jgi:phage terminase small subunit